MNVNASIVDQRVRKLAEDYETRFGDELNIKNDETKLRSTAFVLLVVQSILEMNTDEAFDCLCEGGNDFGVDAIHISSIVEDQFTVTLFQGKYKHKNLDGQSWFPETGIALMVDAVGALFDPDKHVTLNDRLKPKVEEVRSLIRDGNIPQVRVVLCNNGAYWKQEGQDRIEHAAFGPQVTWEHANHDRLVDLLQASKPVDDSIQLDGQAVIESFDYRRVLLGRMRVDEVGALFNRHGDRLLERNIRRYLGLHGNRVNSGIRDTLTDATEMGNFYFYNNGITFICRKFSHNALQKENYQVKAEGLQVINGGQTCKTIQAALAEAAGSGVDTSKAYVLARIYELPGEEQDLVRNITYATNSQNPVDLRDLRANDTLQRRLETAVADLGFKYVRKREEGGISSTDVPSSTAATAILSIWRESPHQAKYRSSEHFGKLYDKIFTEDLNAAQLVLGALIYRDVERRRRTAPAGAPRFVPYGSCFVAMLVGRYLLKDKGLEVDGLDHRNFADVRQEFDLKKDEYYAKALGELDTAIHNLYGHGLEEVSLQRLSATFRRGDLIEELNKLGTTDAEGTNA